MSLPPAEVPVNPFENIALSLSGGGYRAAGFHLGVMDLLDELNLLEKVTVLSTVSGGTITGMLYAVNNGRGGSYEEFYNQAYKFLTEVNVIERALDQMHRDDGAAQARLSLIRSAAQVYGEHLFDGFGDLTFGDLIDSPHPNLKEIIFNATEFRHGLAFRFMKSSSERARFGNKYFPVSSEVVRRVRLADIVAASSCFPGAFEPINFPDDFRWPGPQGLDNTRADLGAAFKDKEGKCICLPLMDGGIYDNQGIESIDLASQRAEADFGAIIISDTGQRSDAILEFTGKRREGGVTLGVVAWVLRLVFVLSCITMVAVVMKFFGNARDANLAPLEFVRRHPGESAFLYLMPAALAAAVVGLLLWLRILVQRKRCVEVAGTTFDIWKIVRRLSIWDLFSLVQMRTDSMIAMSSTIFLKRVRSQSFRRFAEDPKYRKRTIFNLIYRMTTRHPGLLAKENALEPSEKLTDLAARMEKVETKLWVRNEDELKDLIACGQATACFNLLRYLWKVYEAQIKSQDDLIYPVYHQAMAAWEKLKNDPQNRLTRNRAQRSGQKAQQSAAAPCAPSGLPLAGSEEKPVGQPSEPYETL